MNYSFIGIQITTIPKPWKFMHIPERLIQIAGYNKKDIENLFGNNFSEMVAKKDRERIEMELECQLNLGNSFILEYEIIAKNSESIHLIYMGNRLIINEEAVLCGGLSLCPTSLSLEEYYRNILDCLPTPVFITDSALTINFLNQAAQKCSGLSLEDCKGKLWSSVHRSLETAPDFFLERFRSDGSTSTLVGSDGQTYQAVFSTLKEPNGKSKGYICVFTDITLLKGTEHLLLLTEEDYRIALSQSRSSIWEYDVASNTILQTKYQANAASVEYNIGTTIENIPDSLLEMNLVPPEFLDELRAMYQRIRSGEKYVESTVQVLQRNGNARWIHINCTTIFDENGQPLRAIGVSKDVTEQKKLEEQYQQERCYRDSLISGAISSYEVDLTDDHVLRLDNEWSVMLELTADISYTYLIEKVIEKAVYSRHSNEVKNILDRDNLLDSYRQGKKDVSCDYMRLDANGNIVWVRSMIYLMSSSSNDHILAIIYIKDIDEQKKHELELKKKAERDPLTGLLNRNASLLRIEKGLVESIKDEQISVMFMIDIDNFKHVNDTYGHISGDTVLREMAKKLCSLFRKEDILGRIGGDEFIVFLKNIPGKPTALEKAVQICCSLNNVYFSNGIQCNLSCSVGMAFAPFHGNSFDSLYEKADIALYYSKSQGKNQYAVYQDGLAKINLDLKRTTFEKDEIYKTISINITEYIFKILFHANNLGMSVKSVLQLVNSHFCGTYSYILEYSEFYKCLTTTFDSAFQNSIAPHKNIHIADFGSLINSFDKDGILEISNAHTETDNILNTIFKNSDAQSVTFCSMLVASKFHGILVIESGDPLHSLSVESRSNLKSSSEVIGMFLHSMHREEEYVDYLGSIQNIIKNDDNITYVVNPKNYRLIFMNKKSREFFPNISLGEKCYKIFCGIDAPCDNCPIKELMKCKKKDVTFKMYNDIAEIWLSVNASLINWPDDGKYCIMNCSIISDYHFPSIEN